MLIRLGVILIILSPPSLDKPIHTDFTLLPAQAEGLVFYLWEGSFLSPSPDTHTLLPEVESEYNPICVFIIIIYSSRGKAAVFGATREQPHFSGGKEEERKE